MKAAELQELVDSFQTAKKKQSFAIRARHETIAFQRIGKVWRMRIVLRAGTIEADGSFVKITDSYYDPADLAIQIGEKAGGSEFRPRATVTVRGDGIRGVEAVGGEE